MGVLILLKKNNLRREPEVVDLTTVRVLIVSVRPD